MLTLRYTNNFCRKIVGEVSIEEFCDCQDVITKILQLYQKAGYSSATDSKRLYISSDNGWIRMTELETIPDNATILYSDLVYPRSAAEWDRKNGIVYFFHISEKGHEKFPHIHARYSGEEISIYFSDFRYLGSMKNRAKLKEAINYVKDNIESLKEEWTRLQF